VVAELKEGRVSSQHVMELHSAMDDVKEQLTETGEQTLLLQQQL
jgi:hypothetical protein